VSLIQTKVNLLIHTTKVATIQSFTAFRAFQEMPFSPDSRYYLTNNGYGPRPTTRSQNGSDFLDNPFRSIISTIAFLGLCAFVVTSVYILSQKYRQARNYKCFPSRARLLPNLESARALSSGIDTGQSWTWQTESEITTADLVDMREGSIDDDEEVSPIEMVSYQDTELDEGDVGDYELERGVRRLTLQDKNTQERYFTPASAASNEDKDLWTKQKRAGEELDQVRRNLRSRRVISNGVVVGQVGDSRIAQRRRTASNRSI
jgi:hypothetical protein